MLEQRFRREPDPEVHHTIAYAEGGLTHASNLKCWCRTHHCCKRSGATGRSAG